MLPVPGGPVGTYKHAQRKLLFFCRQASGVSTLPMGMVPMFVTTTEAIPAQEMLM